MYYAPIDEHLDTRVLIRPQEAKGKLLRRSCARLVAADGAPAIAYAALDLGTYPGVTWPIDQD